MSSEKHKSLWRKLRFWLAMILLIVVTFGLLVLHVHRKSLGPPPTPPGESPEFDVLSGRGSMLLASVPSGTRPYLAEIINAERKRDTHSCMFDHEGTAMFLRLRRI